jgi:hypothetical protein
MGTSDDRAVGERDRPVAIDIPEFDSARGSSALCRVGGDVGSISEHAVSDVAVERANR